MQVTDIYKMLIYKASKDIRKANYLNTHHISILTVCSVYYTYINKSFTLTDIYRLISCYNLYRFKVYFNRLIDCNLITLAGKQRYTIAPDGLNIIKQINDNNDKLVYEFCQKYNIEL